MIEAAMTGTAAVHRRGDARMSADGTRMKIRLWANMRF
jgi:hypothetical protein